MLEVNAMIQPEHVPCPRCDSKKSKIVFEGEDYLYHLPGKFFVSECQDCKFRFQNPRPRLEDIPKAYPVDYAPHIFSSEISQTSSVAIRQTVRTSLGERLRELRHDGSRFFLSRYLGYHHLFDPKYIKSSVRFGECVFHPYLKWISGVRLIPYYVPHGQLLEIGCGRGDLLEYLRGLGWQNIRGIELVPNAAEIARERGFTVDCGRVEDTLKQFPDNYFDVIVSAMTMEHVVNPFDMVRTIAAKLKPGGQFLFSTVIRDSLDGYIYGPYGVSYDFQRHMAYFKKADLSHMLQSHFERIECFHQSASSDFIRPSTWRQELNVGGLLDKVVLALSKMPQHEYASLLLALLGLTGRVSFRCNKSAGVDENV